MPTYSPVGCGNSAVSSSRSRSISSSCSSSNLKPSGPKNLIPLSCMGLCEAEIIIPACELVARVKYATPGVAITPRRITSAPMRSEERRVGKECRARRSTDHHKEKTEGAESHAVQYDNATAM